MKNLIVRRLSSSDEEIARQIAAEFLHRPLVASAHLANLLADERNIVLAALRGNALIGFLVAHVIPNLSGQTLVYLYEIEVVESERRMGVATRIVSMLEDICRARGAARIWVGSSLSNTAACALWASTGAIRVSDQYVEFEYDFEGSDGAPADAVTRGG